MPSRRAGKGDGSSAFNGGGAGSLGSGGGGGATDLRTASRAGDPAASLASRTLVAAGGGGGADLSTIGTAGAGGAGGAPGGDGVLTSLSDPTPGHGGAAGTAVVGAGGAGGSGSLAGGNAGGAGVLAAGGAANGNISGAGGGGGGGLFGGGAGGTGGRSTAGNNAPGGGGGGGSNLVPASGTAATDTTGVPSLTFTFEIVPTVALGPAVVLGADRVLLLGSTSEAQGSISGTFEYGLDTTYGTRVATTNAFLEGGTVSALLTGLTPDTTYHYRLVGTTGLGHVAQTADATFTTLPAGAGTGPQGPAGPPGKDAATPPNLKATVAAAHARRGGRVTLRVSVTNSGGSAAHGVEVAILPSGSLRPLSAKKPFAIARVGTVAAGATRTVSVRLRVSRAAKRGRISVSALVVAGTGLDSSARGRLTIR